MWKCLCFVIYKSNTVSSVKSNSANQGKAVT